MTPQRMQEIAAFLAFHRLDSDLANCARELLREVQSGTGEMSDNEEPQITITPANSGSRVNSAAETILACWPDWEASADEESQLQQDSVAGQLEMLDQIAVVLQGMIFDE